MKKLIAIVAGGDSSEMEVSLKSAEGIRSFIDKERYLPYLVIIRCSEWFVELPGKGRSAVNKNDFSFRQNGVTRHFDLAYITIHGTPGEDGTLQGYFDLIGLPYSGCGTLASAISHNKFVCNSFLRSFGIGVAPSVRIRKGESYNRAEIIKQLGLPLFVKPAGGGSSFGVAKVKDPAQFDEAVAKAFDESNEVIAEQNITGTEVTCGCYKTRSRELALPVTEVLSNNEIFDYDAKYNGQSQEITPARIPQDAARQVQQTTSRIYDLIGAKGLIRIDYIINSEGRPIALDVNTTPGMTPASFIPQQAQAAGLSMTTILTEIIENELSNQ
ncbi:MAG: D-alanine--D-alanine ligase [Tannerellaceae bacterium]|nr:D-alanine--D-alanine ligase [Tannerellaceae bacterium]